MGAATCIRLVYCAAGAQTLDVGLNGGHVKVALPCHPICAGHALAVVGKLVPNGPQGNLAARTIGHPVLVVARVPPAVAGKSRDDQAVCVFLVKVVELLFLLGLGPAEGRDCGIHAAELAQRLACEVGQ